MGLLSFVEDTVPTQLEEKLQWKEKPVVSTSAAVPEKDTNRAKATNPPKEGVLSLSFEQVNDNADELIELRGAGRYFGATDPTTGESVDAQGGSGRICDNCHKRGHIRAKCKTVICHKCGIVGDHYESQCPTTIVCSRCGERGHTWGTCTSKTRKQQYCKSCDVHSHSEDNCPSIWRSYLTIACKNPILPPSYCYNCAADSHFGDECPEPRTSRIPNSSGSAFSGNNLPKELRNEYFDKCFGKKTSFPEPSRNYSSYGDNNSYGNGSYGNTNYGGSYNNSYGTTSYGNNKNSYGTNNNSYGTNNSYSHTGNKGNKSGGAGNGNGNANGNNKKRSFQSMSAPSSKNYEPSRSGFLASKTGSKKAQNSSKNFQASRSGFLPGKPKGQNNNQGNNNQKQNNSMKPDRSGVVPKKKRGKKSKGNA